MKKLLLLATILGAGWFSSCKTEPPEPPEPPEEQFAAIWDTTHHLVSMEVAYVLPEIFQEHIEEEVELESSTDVSGDEVYRLAFHENGTGSGLMWDPNEQKRHGFDFDWQMAGNQLTITDHDYLGVPMLIAGSFSTGAEIVWTVEEQTDDKMVLSTTGARLCDSSIDDYLVSWREEYIFRYTFERVK